MNTLFLVIIPAIMFFVVYWFVRKEVNRLIAEGALKEAPERFMAEFLAIMLAILLAGWYPVTIVAYVIYKVSKGLEKK